MPAGPKDAVATVIFPRCSTRQVQGRAGHQVDWSALSGTIADTDIVGPPQAVNVSAIVMVEATPGNLTSIELTTGHVCSPSEGTSLDSTTKPTLADFPGGTVSDVGAISKTDPSPVERTVVFNKVAWEPCKAPTSVMAGLPSRVQATVEVFNKFTGLKIEPAAPVPCCATSFNWLATHGAPAVNATVVVVVVVVDVLVVEVVEGVVEVVTTAGLVLAEVVVVVIVFEEQPATSAADAEDNHKHPHGC